jgi:hypothetical protein
MQNKHAHDRMDLEQRASAPDAKRHISMRPSVTRPPRHSTGQDQRSGDGCAFEVLAFARCVFGQHGDGDVEAGQTREAAENEEGEEEVVEGRADAEGEGGCGGGDTEGYLLWFLLVDVVCSCCCTMEGCVWCNERLEVNLPDQLKSLVPGPSSWPSSSIALPCRP